VTVLLGLGYLIGEEEALIRKYLSQITIGLIAGSAVLVAVYIYWKKRLIR
jgi:membrane protein DedA with SNARE-associated domain